MLYHIGRRRKKTGQLSILRTRDSLLLVTYIYLYFTEQEKGQIALNDSGISLSFSSSPLEREEKKKKAFEIQDKAPTERFLQVFSLPKGPKPMRNSLS